ncbi:MAG: phosphonate ABC transporter, permease protein PhnE [Fibrobacterota bacterium]
MSKLSVKKGVWSAPKLIKSPWKRFALYLFCLGFVGSALFSIDIDPERISRGAVRAAELFRGFLSPDFIHMGPVIWDGITESIAMTVVATVMGIILSIPVAFGAAKNIAPLPVYLLCRAIISVSRSFQEVIVAIFFVVAIGFGPLAGVFTLAFSSIGFLGKLMSETIEEVDPVQLEAVQATGAGWFIWVVYAIVPQIMPRFAGLCLYRLDINFRESSVIGIVGAGGIGATLNTAFARYDYEIAAAVLLSIIGIVVLTEYVSTIIRKRYH